MSDEKTELIERSRSKQGGAGGLGGAGSEFQAPDAIDDDVDLVRALFAEFAGSLFITFAVLGSVYGTAVVTLDVVTTDRSLYIALAYGAAYAMALYALSFPAADRRQIANMRHLNPAVTFALVASFKIHVGRALLYWLAQVTGAGVGVLFIWGFTPVEKKTVLTAYPVVENANIFHEWTMEISVSFILITVILMTVFGFLSKQPSIVAQVHETAPLTQHEVNCLIIFCAVVGCNLAAGPVSGGYMNPLFAIGIGILSGTYQAAPFVAPFFGAFLGVIIGLIFGFKVEFMYFKTNK